MKKLNILKTLILFVIAFIGISSLKGQIIFTTTPDTTAILNDLYTYDVNVTANPPEVTFSLVEGRENMIIDPVTGVITWTPLNINQGGKVRVKASNAAGDYYQEFYIYVSDAIACPDQLISYWDIDHSIGNTYYDNANSYDAVFSGDTPPVITDGIVGKSLKLDPQGIANTFLQVEDSDQYEWQYNDDFSISLWFKNKTPVFTEQTEVFIGRSMDQGSWWFGWNPSTLYVTAYLKDRSGDDATAERNKSIGDTLWHHAVLVYEGSQTGMDYIRLYVDNTVTTTSKNFNTGRFDGTGMLTIGYWNEFGTNKYPFSGHLDEIAIFNRALSASEVTQLYNKGNSGIPICQAGNYAPVFTTTPVVSVDEDSPYSYTVLARDYEGQSLTYSAAVLPRWLSFDPGTRVLSGTPDNDNVGDTTATLLVSDGIDTVEQTFTLTVKNVNDLPVFTTTPVTSVDEDTPYSYTASATDIDAGSSITYSAPVLPGWLSFNTATRVLSGTPTNDQVGTDPYRNYNVTIRATDNTMAYTDQSFVIKVTNINDAPVITNKESISTDEDIPVTISLSDLTATDVDNVYPDDFTLTVKDGTNYSYTGNSVTPAPNYHGTISVNFDLSDGQAIVSDVIEVTVNSVNDLPIYTSAPIKTATAGTLYTYAITATDADDDALTFSVVKKPDWLSFDAGTHIIAGTPGSTNVGKDSVVIQVNDGIANVYQRFAITVSSETGINDLAQTGSLVANVYPLPVNDVLQIVFTRKLTANIEIIDFTGKVVKTNSFSSAINDIVIDVNDLKPGIYFCKIKSNEENQVIKFIKK
jgi:hypothetical protein